MTTEEFLVRVWEMASGRVDSAMLTRFFLHPVVAVMFAIRAALRQIDGTRPSVFFMSVFANGGRRREIFREIGKDVGSVFVIALILDLIYQLVDFQAVYPGQAFIVALVLSVIPYLLIRGPVIRILRKIPLNSPWFYIGLLLMQTIGVCILFWKGVPLYRKLLVEPGYYDHSEKTRIWSLGAIALIQIGYWIRFTLRPPRPKYYNPFLGHIFLFLSRLSFMLATASFVFVFLQARLGDRMIFARHVLTMASIFSLYCFMRELNALGMSLSPDEKPDVKPAVTDHENPVNLKPESFTQ